MRTAFINKQIEKSIIHDGYIVVDFTKPGELEEIKNTFNNLGFRKDNEVKLRKSVVHESAARKNEIYEKFYPIFQRAINRFMVDYKLARVAIVDKHPGGGAINVHQHVNLIDELKHRSFTAWMPTVDTTVEMGTLYVVKKSHTIFAPKIQPFNDFSKFQDKLSHKILKKYSTPLLLQAGQAVIFDDRLIHWSPPNMTTERRTAFQLQLLPWETESDLTIYYRANDEELSKYKISPKTYRETDLAHNMPDDLVLLGSIKQPRFSYNNRQFIAMMKPSDFYRTNHNRNLFQRLFDQ